MSLLIKSSDGPSLVVCSTCRHDDEHRDDAQGVRGGARLLEALRAAAAGRPDLSGLAIEAMPCLFACSTYCAVHLRSPDKIGYVLGNFRATLEDAEAILDYALHYLASAEGVVPYRDWPDGVKGHFIVRTPPPGKVIGE